MANYRVDLANLDNVIKRTIEAINSSKTELYEIAEGARDECKRLEEELEYIKNSYQKRLKVSNFLRKSLKKARNI